MQTNIKREVALNPLEQLQGFGLPAVLQNARKKPANYYDTITMATGTTEYFLFNNPVISLPIRNKQFPISGNEIFIINSVKASLGQLLPAISATNNELFTRAYFELSVNDKQVLKVPLCEILSFQSAVATAGHEPFFFERDKKLRFPIIINSMASVKVRIAMTSNAVVNSNTIKIELGGIKIDKLSQLNIDFTTSKLFERLNYTIYDTVANSNPTVTKTLDMFADTSKSNGDWNKSFPLSNYEVFSIENIELFFPILSGGDSSTVPPIINLLRNSAFRLVVEDNEIMNFASSEIITPLIYTNTTTSAFSVTPNTKSKFGFTLPEPIEIGTNSRVKVQFDYQGLAAGTVCPYFTAMLKGTLQRKLQ